jgi:hypothetical protein
VWYLEVGDADLPLLGVLVFGQLALERLCYHSVVPVLLQCCCSVVLLRVVTVLLQCCHSSITVLFQCCYRGLHELPGNPLGGDALDGVVAVVGEGAAGLDL